MKKKFGALALATSMFFVADSYAMDFSEIPFSATDITTEGTITLNLGGEECVCVFVCVGV